MELDNHVINKKVVQYRLNYTLSVNKTEWIKMCNDVRKTTYLHDEFINEWTKENEIKVSKLLGRPPNIILKRYSEFDDWRKKLKGIIKSNEKFEEKFEEKFYQIDNNFPKKTLFVNIEERKRSLQRWIIEMHLYFVELDNANKYKPLEQVVNDFFKEPVVNDFFKEPVVKTLNPAGKGGGHRRRKKSVTKRKSRKKAVTKRRKVSKSRKSKRRLKTKRR